VTVPVAGDTSRPVAILDVPRWAAAIARAGKCRLELALDHRLDELPHPIPQPGFDRIKPVIEKTHRRLRF
jgi:hypothetical protein